MDVKSRLIKRRKNYAILDIIVAAVLFLPCSIMMLKGATAATVTFFIGSIITGFLAGVLALKDKTNEFLINEILPEEVSYKLFLSSVLPVTILSSGIYNQAFAFCFITSAFLPAVIIGVDFSALFVLKFYHQDPISKMGWLR